MFDYETIRLIWWILIGVVAIAFALTEGFEGLAGGRTLKHFDVTVGPVAAPPTTPAAAAAPAVPAALAGPGPGEWRYTAVS